MFSYLQLRFLGISWSVFFHLSSTWDQKGLPILNSCAMLGGFARNRIESSCSGLIILFQMSLERCVLFNQEHCREVQCSTRLGMPSPPACVGVNIISFLY